jgi:hypothetical protein
MLYSVVEKKLNACFILKFSRKEYSEACKICVALPSRIFNRSKNGSVLQNEGKVIRIVLFLSNY